MLQQGDKPYARDLTDEQRGELIDQAIARLRRRHDGGMYGCVDCYHGRACGERELVRWYDEVKVLAAQA